MQPDRRTVLSGATIAALGLASGGVQSAVRWTPERFEPRGAPAVDAERGEIEVPEDRRDPRSRLIPIRFLRFRSTAERPGPPLIYLAGGPGGSGIQTAKGARFPLFMALRSVGDVIALDQRGTGASNSIPPLPPLDTSGVVLTRNALTEYVRTEVQRLWPLWTAQGVAMRGYNTRESAADIEDLRIALGAEKVHLWGISYGSHLALAALKHHERSIGRVALASLEGLDQTVKLPSAGDSYLSRIDRLLGADPALRRAVPDLPALMRRVHARLEAEPIRVKARTPRGEMEVTGGGFAVQLIAGNLIKNPDTLALLPRLYLEIDQGRFEMLGMMAAQAGGGAPRVSGMPEAMDLASGITPGRLARVRREAGTAVLGDALNYPMPHLLGAVPGMDLGDGFRRAIRTRIPAMLIAGSLDGRTPLSEQDEVATNFLNKTRITVENAGHDVLETSPRIAEVMTAFFKGEAVRDETITLPPVRFMPPA